MAQEQTEKTMTPDSKLEGGKVRPKSKVKILFTNSEFHNVPFVIEEVHPSLAEKLVEQGKAEYAKSNKLTKDQMDANKESLKSKVKAKGRRPGKTKKDEAAEDLMEDLDATK